MEFFLEIIKLTVPSLITFGIVYFIMNNFFGHQKYLTLMEQKKNQSKDFIIMRLQAYERLILFTERISVDNLSMRIQHPEMGVNELRNAMLVAIQQEFEHNMTQQIYVSDKLWEIILYAKNEVQNLVANIEGNDTVEYRNNLIKSLTDQAQITLLKTKNAIAAESKLLFETN